MADDDVATRCELLRAAHRSVTAEIVTLRHEIRERVSRVEVLEHRLQDIEECEQVL